MSRLVQKARELAAFKHRRQTRKHDATPYMDHIEGVVAILRRHGYESDALIAAAYLHDTVESTDMSVGEVFDLFGTEVAKLVYWLTDEEGEIRTMRKMISAWRLSRAPFDAKLIKLADIIDNSRHIMEHDSGLWPSFLLEKKQIMWMMADEEGERITRLPIFREAMINTASSTGDAPDHAAQH